MKIEQLKELIAALGPAGEATKELILLHIAKEYLGMLLLTGVIIYVIRAFIRFATGDVRRSIQEEYQREFEKEMRSIRSTSFFNDVHIIGSVLEAFREILKEHSTEVKTYSGYKYKELTKSVAEKLATHLKNFKPEEMK